MNDEDQVREAQALWAQYEADRDADAWAALMTEDARYIRPDGSVTVGRDAIRQSLIDRTAGRAKGRHSAHVFGPTIVKVTGDTAESAAEHIAYGRATADDPWSIIVIGRFNTQLVKRDGKWYFTEVGNRGYFHGDPPPDKLPSLHRD
jgi:uncharacterized protein (TIGR02246 family)